MLNVFQPQNAKSCTQTRQGICRDDQSWVANQVVSRLVLSSAAHLQAVILCNEVTSQLYFSLTFFQL